MKQAQVSKINGLIAKLNYRSGIHVMIGDDGALFAHIVNDDIISRHFLSSTTDSHLDNVLSYLNEHHKEPIFLYIDIHEQNYTHQSFPSVSALTIESLVKKRLERDIPKENLRGYIQLTKNKVAKKDWLYLMISCPVEGILQDWLKIFYNKILNALKSISLLPIELTNVLSQVNKSLISKKQRSEWQIIVTHNKVSGIRQAAFKDEKLMFTRLVPCGGEINAKTISGIIEQEVQNTIEYIKRLYFKGTETIDLISFTSEEIAKNITNNNFIFRNHLSISPADSGNILGFNSSWVSGDGFTDSMLLQFLASKSTLLNFTTEDSRYLLILQKIDYYSKYAKYLIILFGIALIINNISEFISYSNDASLSARRLNDIENNLVNVTKKYGPNLQDGIRMAETVRIYKLLSANQFSPIDVMFNLATARDNNIYVKSMTWTLDGVPSNIKYLSDLENKKPYVNANIEILYLDDSNNYQLLFDKFDQFTKNADKIFNDYNLEYSRVNDQISFDQKSSSIPIRIILTSKNSL
jgi:hypothetical protein